jgi:hypothetical protein
MRCPLLFAVLAFTLSASQVHAGPRDELLRVAPRDAALIVVVQNGRDHARNLAESPFGQWFPTTTFGKRLLDSTQLKQFRDSSAAILKELGTTRQELIDDVFGDAIAFAFSPASRGRSNDERAVILVRPRKPETLAKIIEKLNAFQTMNGELKAVARHEYTGGEYFERQKPEGGSEYYCFRGGVFAFSTSEADVKAIIDQDKAAAPVGEKVPELVARMQSLGVADAAAVVLVNPRALDAEVKAKAAAAKPDMKRFLDKFAEVWAGIDSAAIYLTFDKHVEVGLSLRFQPDKLPPEAKKFLASLREPSTAAYLIPKDALFGVAGHVRAAELIDLVASLAPIEAGKPGVKEWVAKTLGPIVGRDNLPLVLDSLGPNWVIWAEHPVAESYLPTLAAAIEIGGDAEAKAKAEKSLVQAVEFGFTMARIAYNSGHTDQIEVKEEKDPKTGAAIKSLVNEKGFPPGFRPSFAIKQGYLVLATSPDAIKRFDPTVPKPALPRETSTLAKLNGTQMRAYLQTHGAKLAKFLADIGIGNEKGLAEHIANLADVLELVDSAEVILRSDEKGLQIAVRVNPAKPLKK